MHDTQVCMFCRYRRSTGGATAGAACCADRREARHAAEPAPAAPRRAPPERPRHGAFVGQRH